jgi:hypothetical protein
MRIRDLDQVYTDRFGHEWSIGTERKRGKARHFTFTCGEFKLIAVDGDTNGSDDLNPTRVKDLFCDAERVLAHGSETWYVGYRTRAGRGGRTQAGIFTRFRSERGETRFTRTMLCFRHMPEAALCEHLAASEVVKR